MENKILEVIRYFQIFDYPPDFEEIYTFLTQKTSKKALKIAILKLERKKKLIFIKKYKRYTLPEYCPHTVLVEESGVMRHLAKRRQISKRKLNNWRFKIYLKLLSLFPQIKLVGLSGRLAMMNAEKEDDIDLFIIAASHRLFTARFIAVILAKILGIYPKRRKESAANKVCLNLFFDESQLSAPKFKKTEYVAHEILQMRPFINKDAVYQRFLKANDWVFKIFPNSILKTKLQILKTQIKDKKYSCFISDRLEEVLKKFQLILIERHRTNEIISTTQLWFHREDFGEKIKRGY